MYEAGALSRTYAEHQAILSARTARDPDAARLRMGVHLLGVEEYLSTTQLDSDTAWASC